LAAIALLLQRGQARASFEDDLVREYRKTIKPDLLTKALISPDLEDAQLKLVVDFYPYIDLSNEQTFLRMVGRVGRRTWRQWCDGIQGNLERPAFASAWKTIRTCAPDDFSELQLLDDSGFRDPRSWQPLRIRMWLWLRREEASTIEVGHQLLLRQKIVHGHDRWSTAD